MIEILTPDDVSKIKDCYIAEYIKNLLTNLLTQTSDCSLETVGGIFYVENELQKVWFVLKNNRKQI